MFNVFGNFAKIRNHFPKISEDFPKCVQRPDECFQTFSEKFQNFPKISEDTCNPTVLKTFEEDLKMLRSYTSKFKCSTVEGNIIKNDILTCWILFLSICYHSVYH